MIPIRDTIQSRNYPVVNYVIIAANVAVYLFQSGQGERLNQFVILYGLVPARYSSPSIASHFTLAQQVFSFLSFMFLHGGFWHLLGNMWSLHIFGDNVEDRLGPVRYLLFYFSCGIVSGLSHLLVNFHSRIPTIGASGAIAGVMGAYFLLYPNSRIITFVPIFFLPYVFEVPAYFFLGAWFILQFISATGTSALGGGIAWWAHIGGFVFGMISLKVFGWIPETRFGGRLRQKTSKKTSHRLQVLNTFSSADDPHTYGSIVITAREAREGTRKLISIPSGYKKRIFRVSVPPGSREGTLLRLTGVGNEVRGRRGDLYLRVKLRP